MKPFCGGVVVGEEWVITAAHCFDYESPYSVLLYAGKYYRALYEESLEQGSFVIEAFIHPDYRNVMQGLRDDIALLRIAPPFYRTDFIKAACVPRAPVALGTQCYVIGWGDTDDPTIHALFLRQADVPIVNKTICQQRYHTLPKRRNLTLWEGSICAGHMGKGGKDSCKGDSGGPLLCHSGGGSSTSSILQGQWIVRGIVSYGDGCASKDFMGIYTDVYHYLDWIKQRVTRSSQSSLW